MDMEEEIRGREARVVGCLFTNGDLLPELLLRFCSHPPPIALDRFRFWGHPRAQPGRKGQELFSSWR